MFFGNFLKVDAETWAYLKSLAGSELHSPHCYVRLLVRREWEAWRLRTEETIPTQSGPSASPSIPTIYHIRQGK